MFENLNDSVDSKFFFRNSTVHPEDLQPTRSTQVKFRQNNHIVAPYLILRYASASLVFEGSMVVRASLRTEHTLNYCTSNKTLLL